MEWNIRRRWWGHKVLLGILGIFALWGSLAIAAQWLPIDGVQNPNDIQVQVSQRTPGEIILDLSIPGIWMDEISATVGDFVTLQLPEGGISGEVGKPQFPALRELIAVPDGGKVTWEIIGEREVTLPLPILQQKPPYPQQPPIEKRPGALANAPFAWDRNYYQQDQWSPGNRVEVGERSYL